jgi:Probable zinc-ribbon domain
VADLIIAERNASLERTSLERRSNTSQRNVLSSDDDLQQPSISTYPIINQKFPNACEVLGGHHRNSSARSFGSEENFIEREKGSKLEKTIIPSIRRPNSYNASSSSRSISSDEGGSTISRNAHAVSRRTHKRDISIASAVESLEASQYIEGMGYNSNYEEEKIKPKLIETVYPVNEYEMDQQSRKAQYRIISKEEIEEREPDSTFNSNSSYQRGRDLNSSFDEAAGYRNRDTPFRYNSKTGQEAVGPKPIPYETNYPLDQSRLSRSSKRDLIDDNSSVQGSLVSEEYIEERAYPSGRNSNASFEGSTSSRSFSSDEGGSRMSAGETRFRSDQTNRSRDLRSDNAYDSPRFSRVEKKSMASEKDDLSDLVNELSKLGLTREKLLLVLLKQTEASIKEESMHQNRNARSLVRQLSIQIPPPESSESGSSKGQKRLVTHCCRPILGGTPFVTCGKCSLLLQLPISMPTHRFVKIRCGECSEIQVCPLPAKDVTYNPLHKAMGYGSARILMAPSRQFSMMDDEN